ncbi:uncharacterized protein LOC123317643 [Coccinella septempunctata]|uniref:uncharacterized protein LOC123317643 n=1 Tax=Coccinella septempunctata TaxID=41139 RepID=UPI001D0684FE|nr:uncharacterized protein LOC123317643 [Coccinella septempunctata]
MASEGEHAESGSAKNIKESEIKCSYCKGKVVESVKCARCYGIFHPGCMERSASVKSAVCKHERSSSDKRDDDIKELQTTNNILNIEISYLRALLKEVLEKNKILIENNNLLMEKLATTQVEKAAEKKGNNVQSNSSSKKSVNRAKQITETENNITSNLKIPNTETSYRNRTSSLLVPPPSVKSVSPLSRPGSLTDSDIYDAQMQNINVKTVSKHNNDYEGEWKTVTGKSKRLDRVICTGSKKLETSVISGASKKKWIYVGKIAGTSVSESMIEEYVKECTEFRNEKIEKANILNVITK